MEMPSSSEPKTGLDIKTKEAFNSREEKNQDTVISSEDLSKFKEKLNLKVVEKAEETGIPKEVLGDYFGLDIEGLSEYDLHPADLELIEENMNYALDGVWRNKKSDKVYAEHPFVFDKILKFISERKKIIGLGELALYLSSFGPAVWKDLAASDVKVYVDGGSVSIKDIKENPELMKTIDQAGSSNSPADLVVIFSNMETFEDRDSGISFSFLTRSIEKSEQVDKFVYMSDWSGSSASREMLLNNLEERGISLDYEKGGCPMEYFLENKEDIAAIFSQSLKIPKENISAHMDSFIFPDSAKISIVEFDDFRANLNINDDTDNKLSEAIKKREEVYGKYNIDLFENYDIEKIKKADKELDAWAKEEGYDNFNYALYEMLKEQENSPVRTMEKMKIYEKVYGEYENNDEFKRIFLEKFQDSGYSLEDTRKLAKENPEAVMRIICEIIAANCEYDLLECCNLIYNDLVGKSGSDFLKIEKFQEEKHEAGIPYVTLNTGKGVCHDYGITLCAAKKVLEEEGVPIGEFVVLCAVSEKQSHLWNVAVTVDNDGKIIATYFDPTRYDSTGELGANGDFHYFGKMKERIGKSQEEFLKNIEKFKTLVLQENLKGLLTQYIDRKEKDELISESRKEKEQKNELISKIRKRIFRK